MRVPSRNMPADAQSWMSQVVEKNQAALVIKTIRAQRDLRHEGVS